MILKIQYKAYFKADNVVVDAKEAEEQIRIIFSQGFVRSKENNGIYIPTSDIKFIKLTEGE